MPDLARCNNVECIKHNNCYRYNEEKVKEQGYTVDFKCICEQENYIYYSPSNQKSEHE